jgi:hypothetical protein
VTAKHRQSPPRMARRWHGRREHDDGFHWRRLPAGRRARPILTHHAPRCRKPKGLTAHRRIKTVRASGAGPRVAAGRPAHTAPQYGLHFHATSPAISFATWAAADSGALQCHPQPLVGRLRDLSSQSRLTPATTSPTSSTSPATGPMRAPRSWTVASASLICTSPYAAHP